MQARNHRQDPKSRRSLKGRAALIALALAAIQTLFAAIELLLRLVGA